MTFHLSIFRPSEDKKQTKTSADFMNLENLDVAICHILWKFEDLGANSDDQSYKVVRFYSFFQRSGKHWTHKTMNYHNCQENKMYLVFCR